MMHSMAELYKVQAIASGLLPPWRGKVLSRGPKSFQELRNTISKVQVELSDLPQNLSHHSSVGPTFARKKNCLHYLLENKDFHANADELKNYLLQIPSRYATAMTSIFLN